MHKTHLTVPTVSVIGHRADPREVYVFRSSKFTCTGPFASDGPARVIVGGKQIIGAGQEVQECGSQEWWEEAGGWKQEGDIPSSNLSTLWLPMVITDPVRDIRDGKTIEAITDGHCTQPLGKHKVAAHYGCPDHVLAARVAGDISVDGRELLSHEVLDVTTLTVDELLHTFGAGHGMALAVYRALLSVPREYRHTVAVPNVDAVEFMLRETGAVTLTELRPR